MNPMNTLTKLVALAAVAVLATSAFAQRGQGGGGGGQGRGGGFGQGRGGMMGGMMGNLFLVQRADVKADLGLSAEQGSKLEALQTAQREEMRAMFQNGGGGGDREAMMAAFQKMNEETDKKVAAILTGPQNKRLLEIQVQLAGDRALLLPAVQKNLALNESQLAKIKDLQAKQQEANQSIMERMRNGELERDQIGELRAKNDKILGEELAKIMTTDQAAKLKAMAGKPFKADNGGG